MKKNLVILFGGPSVEHDVSVITGLQAVGHADSSKYNVIPVYWDKAGGFIVGDESTTTAQTQFKAMLKAPNFALLSHQGFEVQQAGIFNKRRFRKADVVIPCFHGTAGEDGAAQGMLEVLDVPYAGSNVTSSAIGMDKVLFKAVMKANNIEVLPYQVVTKRDGLDIKKMEFDFPVIVKPAHLGSSIGVKKCESVAEVHDALEVIFNLDTTALIEPFLTNMKEVNCSVLGTTDECKASVCEEPISADEILSFEDKYMRGGKGAKSGVKGMASLDRKIPAPISDEQTKHIQELAQQVFQACGCAGIARIDCMIDQDSHKIYVTEINTIPGSLSFYLWEASGMSFRDLVDKLVEIAEKEYIKKKSLKHSFESDILKKFTQ